MTGCRTVSTVQLVGDGSGIVTPGEIEPSDLAVSVSRPFGSPDEQGRRPVERVWLAEQDFEDALGVCDPDEEDAADADAVIVLANVPLPDDFQGTSASELSVDVTVSQIETANSRGCPRCASDMAETFENGGCSVCGFYFDGEHLTDARQAELDRIHDEYQEL